MDINTRVTNLEKRMAHMEKQHKPTPAPEPIPWPEEYRHIGAAIDKLDKEGHLERENETPLYAGGHAHYPENRQPEASRPLPAAVEEIKADVLDELKSQFEHGSSNLNTAVAEQIITSAWLRLAALWPKAGQVPSVGEFADWQIRTWPSGVELPGDFFTQLRLFLLSRMGQPAKPDKFDCDNCDVTDLRPVQPPPVTAEEMADFLLVKNWIARCAQARHLCKDADAQEAIDRVFEEVSKRIKAFPTLGSNRLTRDAVKNIILRFGGGLLPIDDCVSDILALQPKVSKERVKEISNTIRERHVLTAIDIEWLREVVSQTAELLGVEVSDD